VKEKGSREDMPSTRLTHKSSKFSSGRLKRDSKQPSLLSEFHYSLHMFHSVI